MTTESQTSHQPTLAALTAQWPGFSQAILDFMRELGLDGLGLECDHAALRVNTSQGADSLRDAFCRQGEIISNNVINGRPILIIALDKPWMLGELAIDCIELPYPGNKSYPVEGWEHIELVLPGGATTTDTLCQQLLARVPTLAPVLAQETEIKVKMSSPQGEHERLANPTIAFKRGNLCIKVHPHGIKTVIASEAK
ncbi:VOC family protein [Shewanella sp. Isolate7]|uniref:VOC family protein n=1 Tax=Shewanella sp. Isolate7 TaxID=2908528 RepID=UPI001EFE40E3|nr:VOC family protein [Shewanella sp. Isolate7]MCG9722798.1 VOC family protein [Shewanella sp. Isolate7]